MSDTPRTDRAWRRLTKNYAVTGLAACEMRKFAEKLERELNSSKLPGVSTPPKPAVQPKPVFPSNMNVRTYTISDARKKKATKPRRKK